MAESEPTNEGSGFQVSDDAPTHYQAAVERFMAPFVSAVVTQAASPGDNVLDVACGTGFATRAAARVVGESGSVVGTDLNAGMLTMARTVPFEGIDISWRQAFALDLPYADGESDAVLCSQGVQFFPNPSSGLPEMARVLRSGGRMAVTMWDELEQNPFFAAEVDMSFAIAAWSLTPGRVDSVPVARRSSPGSRRPDWTWSTSNSSKSPSRSRRRRSTYLST